MKNSKKIEKILKKLDNQVTEDSWSVEVTQEELLILEKNPNCHPDLNLSGRTGYYKGKMVMIEV